MSILAFIVLLPLAAALLLCWVPRNYKTVVEAVAWLTTFIVMVLALILFCHFNGAATDADGYKFAARIPGLGMDSLGIACRLGVDGINVGLILMGAVVAFAAVCVSWAEIKTYHKE